MIYPGARWIHRSGKGMEVFGLNQINDVKLEQIDYYPDSHEIFQQVAIADGLSIVLKNSNKKAPGFNYRYHKAGKTTSTYVDNPGKELLMLNPTDSLITNKTDNFVNEKKLNYISNRILSQKLFAIESDYVEKNPNLVRDYEEGDLFNYPDEIKILTNDKAGKMGRAKWYITDRKNIPSGQEYIDQWKVVVSSANAGGQKRDSQMEIIDNMSAFGRSRVALAVFRTKEEAVNFYNYAKTYLIKFLFLMTDESLTSLGKKVIDISDYSNSNTLLDFSKDLNSQLFDIVGLTDKEREYIIGTVENIRSSK